MKKTILSLLYLFMALSLHSCHNEDDEDHIYCPYLIPEDFFWDGADISDISLCCVEVPTPTIKKNKWDDYCAKTKTLNNYNGFELYLIINKNINIKNMLGAESIQLDYHIQKVQFINKSYQEQPNGIGWPPVFSAYLNGEAKITCDKVLFGEPAGSNLGPHFIIKPNIQCLPVGKEEPKLLYDYGDTIPQTWNERLCNEVWIQKEYILNLAQEPSEKYDEITLHLSLPLTIEHTWDWAVAKYNGEDPSPIYSDTTFHAECKMKFKWE